MTATDSPRLRVVALTSPRLCTAHSRPPVYRGRGTTWFYYCYQPTTQGVLAGPQTEPQPRCDKHLPKEAQP